MRAKTGNRQSKLPRAERRRWLHACAWRWRAGVGTSHVLEVRRCPLAPEPYRCGCGVVDTWDDRLTGVSEDALTAATRLMIEHTRNLVEPAGAAALAAVLDKPERFAGREVAIVCSGGNISPAQLAGLWAEFRS
jgi:threonine synthase